MRWNRQTVRTLVVVLVAIIAAAVLARTAGTDDGGATAGARDDPTTSVTQSGGTESGGVDPDSGLEWISADELPSEAQSTLRLIDEGGPFPYPDKDGSTFENREGILPDEPRGYYAEYTVPTPGEGDRGPRRIIGGDGGELYWTADHYESFQRIAREPGG